MKTQISRISILQSSKIATALYVLFGLIYSLIGVMLFLFGGAAVRIMSVVYIMMPVIMGVIGFVSFVLFAAIYNVLAKKLGGFEFETVSKE